MSEIIRTALMLGVWATLTAALLWGYIRLVNLALDVIFRDPQERR